MRFALVSLPTFIIGTLPVTTALTGRLAGDTTPLRQLLPPLILVSAGLIAINADALRDVRRGRAASDV